MDRRVEIIKDKYPAGTKIKIVDINEIDYHPEMVGKVVTVNFVDDMGQLFCVDDDGHSVTVCSLYGDRFFTVGDNE